jgi:lysophospholipase L1-like esterase
MNRNWLFGFVILLSVSKAGAVPFVMGALGDSITVGFNSSAIGENRDLSWATGLDPGVRVRSHAFRLKSHYSYTDLKAHNMAAVGATSADLAAQTSKLAHHNPKYVTLLLGANDLCRFASEDQTFLVQFEERVDSSVRQMISKNPGVHIVISGVPDIYRLYQLGKRNGCEFQWNITKMCSRLLSPSSTDEVRQWIFDGWKSMNLILEEIANRYPENSVYVANPTSEEFSREDISSYDCFHPSARGQNRLAEVTFRAYLDWKGQLDSNIDQE